MTNSISEQFRGYTGLGDPDPELGLENAKGKSGGKPVDDERLDALHPAQSKDTKVETDTGQRVAEKKAEHAETQKKSTPSARNAKKTAAKKSASKQPAKKAAAKKAGK